MRALAILCLASCSKQPVSLVRDAGSDPGDASTLDAAPFAPEIGGFVRVTLSSGEVHEGELIHRYDHRLWWDNAEDEETWAIFDARRFNVYPEDRSMSFVRASKIAAVEAAPSGDYYRDFLRERTITLDRPPLDGECFVITGHESYHLEENGYGDFAWDLVRTSTSGARYVGLGAENDDYLIWDDPVYLPSAGVVVELEGSAPDHPPGPWPEGAVNNLVGVHLGGQYYVYLLHLRQGSIPATVAVEQPLEERALIGRVGNSGVTLEPHLHVTLLYYDVTQDPPRSFSVPVEFKDLLVRTGTTSVRLPFADPHSGQHLSD